MLKRAALAVLWASFHFQESGLTVASTIGEAAGLQGRHQCVQSSARGSIEAAEVHRDDEMGMRGGRENHNQTSRLKGPSED